LGTEKGGRGKMELEAMQKIALIPKDDFKR
jgi:hypothetical protein